MRNPYFRIDQGNLTPTLDAVMIATDGEVVNLVGATARFEMYELGGVDLIFDRSATVVDPPNGWVRYTWQSGDTTTPGTYLGKFEITYSDLSVQRFPENRFVEITVS